MNPNFHPELNPRTHRTGIAERLVIDVPQSESYLTVNHGCEFVEEET